MSTRELLHTTQPHIRRLQDGMNGVDSLWEPAIIANVLSRHLKRYPASIVGDSDATAHSQPQMITFDHNGITKHPNHTPIPSSHAYLPSDSVQRPLLVTLVSPSVWAKFWGPIPAVFAIGRNTVLGDTARQHEILIISSPFAWITAVWVMMAHWSQLVWFRWLYLALSRLMWMNELRIMDD